MVQKKNKLLIAIEGLDGCGKETQCKLLSERLTNLGFKNRVISFPNYKSKTGEQITSYLHGDFKLPNGAIYPLYSLDRYFSYINDWKKSYDNSEIIICDRYIDSNIIYQCAQEDDKPRSDSLMTSIYFYEHMILHLPQPDRTYFLTVKNLNILSENMLKRYEGQEDKKDIYERNTNLLYRCNNVSKELEARSNLPYPMFRHFLRYECSNETNMFPIKLINSQLMLWIVKYILDECNIQKFNDSLTRPELEEYLELLLTETAQGYSKLYDC